jgi:hypothetical protein
MKLLGSLIIADEIQMKVPGVVILVLHTSVDHGQTWFGKRLRKVITT